MDPLTPEVSSSQKKKTATSSQKTTEKASTKQLTSRSQSMSRSQSATINPSIAINQASFHEPELSQETQYDKKLHQAAAKMPEEDEDDEPSLASQEVVCLLVNS